MNLEARTASRATVDDEAEAALWRAARGGSTAAREALFSQHAAFARQIAGRHFRRLSHGELDREELRQLAYAGLLEAIDRFDPARGVPFRGYAARRISGSVLDGVGHATELREQISARSRARADRMRSLMVAGADPVSTDDAMRALSELVTGLAIGFLLDSGFAASDTSVDRAPSAYDSLAWKETVARALAALDDLPEREALIIRRHYLEGVAFDLIADLLQLSKGRVSQLHKSAIDGLRRRVIDRPDFRLGQ